MKQQSSKLREQEQAQAQARQQARELAGAREFQSAEEVIRADVAQTKVPEAVKTRLTDSLAKEPPPKSKGPWWKRFIS